MEAADRVEETEMRPDLGYVICKRCGDIIATLPTNRVRRVYGDCGNEACVPNDSEGGVEFD